MFYKPKFCCSCGEKIERIDWKLSTSRRFCEFCEIEHKPYDLIPRFIVGFALLVGVFGFGSYLQKANSDLNSLEKPFEGSSKSRRTLISESRQPGLTNQDTRTPDNSNVHDRASVVSATTDGSSLAVSEKEQLKKRTITSNEPVFFCGALTKKGNPCSRRVKSKERCWQHSGRQSVVSAVKRFKEPGS